LIGYLSGKTKLGEAHINPLKDKSSTQDKYMMKE
jgi:hypothetical protein